MNHSATPSPRTRPRRAGRAAAVRAGLRTAGPAARAAALTFARDARTGALRERLRRPARSALVKDIVLLAVLAFPVAAGLFTPPVADGAWWAQVAGLVLLSAAIAVSRAWPLAALVAVLALVLLNGNYGFAVPVLSYLTGRRSPRARPVLWVFTGVFAGGSLLNLARGVDVTTWFPLTIWLVLLGVLPWLVGRYWRQYQELLRAGWERADRLEREQLIIADRERLRERARIAQDMHDSLGHELALIAVRAGALQVASGLDERHRRAAAELRAGAAEATEHLREIIGVLRVDTAGDAGAAGGGRGGPRTRPAGEGIADLVERAHASGVPVRLQLTGAGAAAPRMPDLPGLVGLAAHRVVQEGITNAAKHAPGAAVTVTVGPRGGGDGGGDGGGQDTVRVRVANQPPEAPPLMPSGGGSGLTGLAERVRLAGGTLRAGPVTGGGFEIVADLPAAPPPAGQPGAAGDAPPRAAPALTAAGAHPGPAARAGHGTADGTAGVPAGAGGVPPGGEWASESARYLERERRQVRRGLIVAIAVPAGLITVLVAVMVAYFVSATFDAVLPPGDYDALRVGDPQARVERVLPSREAMGVGDIKLREPEPAGADCRYYRPDASLLGLSRIYRLCFTGGTLTSKNTYPTGTGGKDGQ
ncbi:hypothetical protein AGRA3207_000398 [Actinomadura graeca]|uniref:histidine kinase n=1 Tax=Actinomadura graeca TaxID=2750812 RepID=A0ABX8QMM9_9ACTN|nr:histidine kinase [Actinomadura graeca]QXJ19803.1 hypothetical protein AGRA3207_000398 [Actinomadura graeca]